MIIQTGLDLRLSLCP